MNGFHVHVRSSADLSKLVHRLAFLPFLSKFIQFFKKKLTLQIINVSVIEIEVEIDIANSVNTEPSIKT